MPKYRFPRYRRGEAVPCFNCGTDVSITTRPSGFYDGGGAFRGTCAKCGMHTYFDLIEDQSTEQRDGGA